ESAAGIPGQTELARWTGHAVQAGYAASRANHPRLVVRAGRPKPPRSPFHEPQRWPGFETDGLPSGPAVGGGLPSRPGARVRRSGREGLAARSTAVEAP